MIVDNDGVDFSTTSLTLPEGTATEDTGELFSAPANTVTGSGSAATAASVVMAAVDGGTAGVTITPTTLDIVEGAAGMYTVALGTQPAGEVLVTIDPGTSATAPVTITPSRVLTFTPMTWETPQTVTVMAAADGDGEGGMRTLVHTVSNYPGVLTAASVTVVVTDDDTAGVTITPTTLDIVEGAAGMYTVALGTQPTGQVLVTIDPGTSTTAPVSITPSLVLTFTPMTWETPQTVTVSADEDDDNENGTRTLAHTVSGYTGVLTAASVTVVVTDDDTAGVTITPTTLDIVEGAAGMYTVALDTQPAGEVLVTIDPGTSATAPVTITPSLVLTFTPMTWETPQTVTVMAAADGDGEGGTRTLAHTVSNYPGVLTAASVTVVVTDDDTAGVTITPTTLDIVEGAAGMYTVALGTQPAGEVLVTIDPGTSATAPVSITPSLVLTFTPMTWETPQTVTVSADEDDDNENGTRTLAHTVSGYTGVRTAASVTVVVTDDDTAGVTITPTTLDIVEGAAGMYTVALGTQPAGEVLVTIDPGTSATAPVTITPSLVLTFTPMTWETPQMVTVMAAADGDGEGGMRTLVHTVSNYPGVLTAASVTVVVTDDDTAGVTITPTTLDIVEGAAGMYTVALGTQPAGEVLVTIDPGTSATAPVTITPSLVLTFTPMTWETPQTVTVSADEDDDNENGTRTLAHTVSGYTGVSTVDPVRVGVTDNERTVTAELRVAGQGLDVDRHSASEASVPENLAENTRVGYDVIDPPRGSTTSVNLQTNLNGKDTATPVEDDCFRITGSNCALVAAAARVSGDAPAQTAPVPGPAQYRLIGNTFYANPAGGAELNGSSLNPAPANEGRGGVLHCADLYNITTGNFASADFEITFDWVAEFDAPGSGFADRSDLRTHSGTVTVQTGDDHACFGVPLVDDDLIEGDERFSVLYRNVRPSGVSFWPRASSYGGLAGQASPGKLDVVIVDNDGVDFSTASLTLPEGTATEDTGELVSAPANTVTGSGNVPTAASMVMAAADDEVPATPEILLSLSRTTVPESASATAVTVTASLLPEGSATLDAATEVAVSVAGGTAGAGDFSAPTVTATIGRGSSRGTAVLLVLAIPDADATEGDETLTVSGVATGFSITPVTLTITDGNAVDRRIINTVRATSSPTSAIVSSLSEGAANTDTTVWLHAEFVPPLTGAGRYRRVVGFGGDTATENQDYCWLSGSNCRSNISSPFSDISDTDDARSSIPLRVLADTDHDPDEFFRLAYIGDPDHPGGFAGYTVVPAMLRIIDNDAPPATVSLGDRTVDESAGTVTLTATLDSAVTGGFEVAVTTSDGTAVAPGDYTARGTGDVTLSFEGTAGETETFTVAIQNDTLDEGDETFTVLLGTPTDMSVAVSTATVTIIDADTAGVTITPTTLDIVEGAAGMYTVALGTQPAGDVEVTIAPDSTVTTAPVTITPGLVLTFTPVTWETAQTVTVMATEDTDNENGTRTLAHTVTGYTEFVGTVDPVTVNVTDNERTVTVELRVAGQGLDVDRQSASEASVPENLAENTMVRYDVIIDPPRGSTTSVNLQTNLNGNDTATPIEDYCFRITGSNTCGTTVSLPFPPFPGGASRGSIFLVITDDNLYEGDEFFTFYGEVPGYTSVPVTLTITDEDTAPTAINLTLSDPTVAEDSGTTNVTVTAAFPGSVTLATPTEVTVSVAGGGTNPATGGSDFTAVTDFTVTIPANALSGEGTFNLAVVNEADGSEVAEGNETLTVSGVATGFTVSSAPLTITDDDTAMITLSTDALNVNENAGTIILTATLNVAVKEESFAMTIMSMDGTATAGVAPAGDYTGFSDVYAIGGVRGLSRRVAVVIRDDSDSEGSESFTVGLSDLSGTVVPVDITSTVTLTIIDDDVPYVTIANMMVDENAGEVTLTAVLDDPVTGGFSVAVSTTDGTATAGVAPAGDYTAFSSTLNFNGDMSEEVTFTVPIVNDTLIEGDETFTVSLGAVTGAAVIVGVGAAATVTIIDDVPGVTITPTTPLAVDEGAQQTYTVVLDSAPTGTATVTIVEDTSTTAPITVTPTGLELVFDSSNWSEAQTVTVAANEDDDALGGTRTLRHTVTNYGSVTAANVVVTVTDNDTAGVTVTPTTLTVTEESAEQTYTVVLDSAPTATATVTIDPGTNPTAPITVTPTGLELVFDSGTWQTAQTVTVTATTDPDAVGGMVTIAHTVTGYTGVASVAPVVVTVVDDDPAGPIPEILLGLSETTVPESDSVVAVTATVSLLPEGGATLDTATEVVISVAGGTAEAEDFSAPTVTATIARGSSRGTAVLPLVAISDTDAAEGDETLTVSGTATGFSITAATLTITDGSAVTGRVITTVRAGEEPDSAIVSSLNEGDANATTTVWLHADFEPDLADRGQVSWGVGAADDTATEGTDYCWEDDSSSCRADDAVIDAPQTAAAQRRATSRAIPIRIVGDTAHEPNEFFTLSATPRGGSRFFPGANGYVGVPSVIEIIDDDAPPATVSLGDQPVDESAGTVTLTATLDSAVTGGFEVQVTTGDGTAVAPGDYTAIGAGALTLTFAGTEGETETFEVTIVNDTLDDDDETFTVSLGSPTVASVAVSTATVTITDDDAPPPGIELSLSPDSVTEGSSGSTTTTQVTVTAALVGGTRAAPTNVTVLVAGGLTGGATAGDVLAAGTDFGTVTGPTITIPANTASATGMFDLVVVGDTLVEGDEIITVSGSADLGGGGALATAAADLTITDDDTAPTSIVLSLSETGATEGDGPTEITVTAAFSGGNGTLASDTVVTVTVGAGLNSATEGVDYETVDDLTLTILAGATSAGDTFTFTVTNDDIVESGETVWVTGSTSATGFGPITPVLLTITEMLTRIDLSLAPSSVSEGNDPTDITVTAAFPVGSTTLASNTVVTLAVGGTGDSATEGTDYTTVGEVTLTIPMGTTSGTGSFPFAVADDSDVETNETVTVSGTVPGSDFPDGVTPATLTIIDNDELQPAFTLGDATVGESESMATVTATLDVAITGAVSVTVETVDGTATAGEDYTALPGTETFMFAMGAAGREVTFTVPILPDTVFEGEETFTVRVSGLSGDGATGLAPGGEATVAITDDDTPPVGLILSVSPDPTITEGEGPTVFTFTATLNPPLASADTLTLADRADGSTADQADYSVDPANSTPLSVDLAAGATIHKFTVTLQVVDDAIAEPSELLVWRAGLENDESDYAGAVESATITIDDDDTSTVSLGDKTVDENAGAVTVTATLSGAVSEAFTVDVFTDDGTRPGAAFGGFDYSAVPTPARLSFTGGVGEERTFTVPITNDDVVEGEETFSVLLRNLQGTTAAVTIGDPAMITINDDDGVTGIELSLSDSEVMEGSDGSTGTTVITVTAGLTSPAGPVGRTEATEVTVSVAGGTATAGPSMDATRDFTTVDSFTITIPAAITATVTTMTFNLEWVGDTLVEGDETVTVSGSADIGAENLATATVDLLIRDDDEVTGMNLSLSPDLVMEGSGGSTAMTVVTVTATLTGGGTRTEATEVTVSVAGDGTGGTATAGDATDTTRDFTTVDSFPITIPAGMISHEGTFNLEWVGDTLVEGDETVTVSGTTTVPGLTVTPAGLTIDDDDEVTGIGLSLSETGASEGASATVTVTAALVGGGTRTEATVVTVAVGADGDLATEGTDYTTVPDLTLTIQAGASSVEGTFAFAALDDDIFDPDETVTVSGTSGSFTFTNTSLAITDTDMAPTAIALSLSETGASEGASATVTVTAAFPGGSATLTSDTVVTVAVGAGGDSATEGTDYTTVPDLTLTIPAGASSVEGTFVFAALDDDIFDPGEMVTVSGTSGSFSFTDTSLEITDTDTAPTEINLTLNPASVDEDSGTTAIMVTAAFPPGSATLTGDTAVTVSVAGGTATAGTDFGTVSDTTVTIPMGMTSATGMFNLTVTEDTTVEAGGETVTVSGTAGSFTIADATLTINDNDSPPTQIALSLSTDSVAETAATTAITVTAAFVGSNAALVSNVEVTVSVAAGTAPAADFTAVDNFTVTILAGATQGTGVFNLVPVNNMVVDGSRTVTVSGTTAAIAITDGVMPATLTITDEDTAPTEIVLSLSPSAAVEEGASAMVTVTATLSPDTTTLGSDTEVTVAVGAGDDSATEGTDYTMVGDLTLTIAAEETSGTVEFAFAASSDTVADPDETVSVSGTSGSFSFTNTSLAITDTDTAPTAIVLSVSEAGASEGGSAMVTVTATLSPDTTTLGSDTVVTVAVGAGDDSATEGTDYTMVGDLTLTIAAEETSGEVEFAFAPLDDDIADPDETVTVSGTAGSFSFTDTSLAITDTDTAPTAIVLSVSPTAPVAEGGSAMVTVTATLSPASPTLDSETVVTVAVGAGDDSATEGTDYTTVDDLTLTIPAGASSVEGTFTFAPQDDAVADPDETVSVSGTSTGFTFTNTSLTIMDTDTAPTAIVLSVSPTAPVAEGASAMVTVTATLSPDTTTLGSDTVVTVAVGAGDDSATEGTDYTMVGDLTLTIAAEATSGTVEFAFAASSDTVADPDETVTVSGTSGSFSFTDTSLAITDTDTAPTAIVLSVSPTDPVAEGASPTVTVTVTATLSPDTTTLGSETVVTVTVGAGDDSATEGTDYTTVGDLTLTIAAEAASGTVEFAFAPLDDDIADPDETVTVSGTAGSFSFTDTSLAITDTNTAPTAIVLSVSQTDAVAEGASAMVTVMATLSPDTTTLGSETVVTVTVGAGDDSATEGTDYTTVGDLTLTIAAGASSGEAEFAFAPLDDAIADPDETVTVTGTSGSFSFTDTSLSIMDTDTAPTAIVLSVSQTDAVAEGGSATVTVTATLSPATTTLGSDTEVTVAVGAGDDSATEGTDYTMVGDLTLTIAAEATSGTVEFPFAALDDTVADPDETVTVSGTSGSFTFTNTSLAITDTDTAPTAIVLSVSQTEAVAEGASATVTVTATLSPATTTLGSDTVVTVAVGAGDDSATEGTDYTTVGDLTLTIAAEAASGTAEFAFAPLDDTAADPGETVTVSGTAPDFTVTGTSLEITETDSVPAVPAITLGDVGVNENVPGGMATVTATLDVAITGALTVTVETVETMDSDATIHATAGTDYTVLPAMTTVEFSAGAATRTQTFTVGIVNDTDPEWDETFMVRVSGLSGPGAAGLTPGGEAEAIVTITSEEPKVVALSVTPESVAEDAGPTDFDFTVTFTPGLFDEDDLEINLDTDATTVVDGTDYSLDPVDFEDTALDLDITTYSFTASINIQEDTLAEGSEFLVWTPRLLSHDGATSPAYDTVTSATLTFLDNDTPTVTLAASTVDENAGTVTVTATLNGEVSGGFSVDVSTTDGTGSDAAIAGTDYTATPTPATLDFTGTPAEEQTFTVPITDNDVEGMAKTFSVSLSNLQGTTDTVTVGDPVMITIIDDDGTPAITLGDVGVDENVPGGMATVTATLDVAITGALTVTVETVETMDDDETVHATAGTDYTSLPAMTTVEFPAQATAGTERTFTVDIVNDSVPEWDETFMVRVSGLSGPAAAGLSPGGEAEAVVTITSEEPTVMALSVTPESVPEGAGPTDFTFTATFTPGLFQEDDLAINLDTDATTAEDGADYSLTPADFDGSALMLDETTYTFTASIDIQQDTLGEGDEILVWAPELPEHDLAGTPYDTATSATLTILDDDTLAPPGVTISDSTLAVGEGTEQTYTVVLDSAPTGTATVTIVPDTTITTAPIAVTPATLTLTFDSTTWGTAQTVTVTASEDDDAEGGTRTLQHMVTNYGSVATASNVEVVVTDNDTAGVTVSPTTLTAMEEGPQQTYTVVLTSAPTGTATVTIAPGTSTTAPITVTPATLTLTFDSSTWDTAQAVTVTATTDPDAEGGTVTLAHTVTGYSGVTSVDSVEVTVTDDDADPMEIELSLDPASVAEESGTTAIMVTAAFPDGTRMLPDATAVTVSVAGGGTNAAVAGTDFTAVTPFTVTIPAGMASGTAMFNLVVAGNTNADGDRTVTVSGTTAATEITSVTPATLTITDNETAPPRIELSLSPASVVENSDMTAITVTAAFPTGSDSLPTATEVTVSVAGGGTNAAPAADFTTVTPFTVTIPAGMTSGTAVFTLTVADNAATDGARTLTVSGTTTADEINGGVTAATLTITDDETAPVQLGSVTVGESDSTVTITATLNVVASGALTVTIETMDGTAIAGEDYTALSGPTTVMFPGGGAVGQTRTVTVPILPDTIFEAEETFTVRPSGVSGAGAAGLTLAGGVATVTITDDDTAPEGLVLSVSPESVLEDAGTVTLTFRATFSPGLDIEDDLLLELDTATTAAAADYTLATIPDQTLPMDTVVHTFTASIDIMDDTIDEPNEVIVWNPAASFHVYTPETPATLTILDNDPAPTQIDLSLSTASVVETSTTTDITVTAAFPTGSSSRSTDTEVTVSVAGGGTNAAVAGTDFTAVDDFTVTIPAGMASGTAVLSLTVADNDVVDGSRTLSVSGSASGITVTQAGLTITITDEDTAPTAIELSLNPTSVDEDSDMTVIMVTAAFPTGSSSLTGTTDVTVSVAGGATNGATAGPSTDATRDFTEVSDFPLTIPAGMTSITGMFTLTVVDDTETETGGESVAVSGTTTASGFTSVTPATLTINDNDSPPTQIDLSLSRSSVAENTGTTPITVTAEFSGTSVPLGSNVEVTVSVAVGTADAADFTAVQPFTVTIPAGSSSGTAVLNLTVADNDVVDGSRTLSVSGTTAATEITSGVMSAELTITDEDTAPTEIELSLSETSVEEDSDTTVIMVTAAFPTGSASLTGTTDVTVSVAGGTATAGPSTDTTRDFTEVSNLTLTIPAEGTSITGMFTLTVVDDMMAEAGGETVTVSGTAGSFTIADATLTINDNDSPPTRIDLSLTPASVAETAATTAITVTAAFAGSNVALGSDVEVTVSVAAGTAPAADFTAVPAFTVTISAGATSGTEMFDLALANNMVVDGSRTVTVSGTTAAIAITDGVMPATLTITDEDTAPTQIDLSLTPASVAESGTTAVTVTAAFPTGSASLTTATDVTVSVAGGGTNAAVAGTDFTAVTNFTVTIPARATEGTGSFNLTVTDDTMAEAGGETVTVSGTSGAFTIADATLTINDDDSPPTQIALTLDPSRVTERSATARAITVTAAFFGSTGTLATATEVTVSVAAGTATAGAATETTRDFTTVSDFTVTIPAGSTRGTASFNLEVYDDSVMEDAETITVSGTTTASGFTGGVMSAELTITANDDAATGIALSLDTDSVAEASGTTPITVTATLTPPDSATLGTATVVTVSVADGTATAGTDFTAVDDFTITIPANATSGTGSFSLEVVNDLFMEPDETVTVSGTAGTFTIADVTLTITDDDSASAPTRINLALSRESVPENIGTATVTVTASFPAGSPAPAIATAVEITLVDGTATAGTDFTAVPAFTVTIPANATSGTASFELMVADDTEVEGTETLTVQGESAGYTIAPVTLAITDGSVAVAMETQREFAKEVFTTVSTAIANRVSRLLSTRASVPDPVPSPTRGRTPTSGSGFDFQTTIARELAAHERDINDGTLSWQKVLDQSSVEFQLDDDADGAGSPDGEVPALGSVGIWAAAEGRVLSDDEGDFGAWDGEVFSGHVGADIRIGRGVGGLAVSSSRGEFDFENDGFDSDIRFLNYSVYGGGPVGEASSLRAAVGYGTGEMETGRGEERHTRDMTMTLGILGGRTNVAAKDGLTLAVEGELWIGQLDSESVGGAENFVLDTRRFQLGLDLTRARQRVSGVQITQGVQLDLRHDGGDGETGSGAGIEGRLGYADPVVGLTATVTGDFLLYHESGLKGAGVGGSVLYRPEPAGRGLSFRTDSSYSASREDISRLWKGSGVVNDADASEAAVFGLETGYGVPVLGGYALLTPYYGFEFIRKDARHHRLGSRLKVGEEIELELEGGHRGNVSDDDSERRLDLRLRVTW